MRTTIHLPDDLFAQAKKIAAESHRTLAAVIEDALRAALAHRRRSSRSAPMKLTTFGKTGLQAAVDLDDTGALLDLMDTSGDPHRR